jgi:hypothetical protein
MADATTAIERPQRKIARTEWPAIAARYAAGESLARIARDYQCTAPAIRYVVQQAAKLGLKPENKSPDRDASRPRGRTPGRENGPPDQVGTESGPPEPPSRISGSAPVSVAGSLSGFDPGLRDMATVEVSAFLVALDAAMAAPLHEDFDRLREATDRLMRAAAHIRIELERVRRPAASVSSIHDDRRLLRRRASGGSFT